MIKNFRKKSVIITIVYTKINDDLTHSNLCGQFYCTILEFISELYKRIIQSNFDTLKSKNDYYQEFIVMTIHAKLSDIEVGHVYNELSGLLYKYNCDKSRLNSSLDEIIDFIQTELKINPRRIRRLCQFK